MKIAITQEEKSHLISSYKVSGLSVRDFVAREKLALSTFYQWLATDSKQKKLRIARVVRHPRPTKKRTDSHSPIAVEIYGARIEVSKAFDRETFISIIDIFQSRNRHQSLNA